MDACPVPRRNPGSGIGVCPDLCLAGAASPSPDLQASMELRKQIEKWREKLRDGTLADSDFREFLQALNGNSSRSQQRLLYLQTGTTGVDSEVLGMSIVENGQVIEGPADAREWPYKTVMEAMQDDWRVVKFPEMALLLQENATFGLGCEFILEK